MGRTALFFGFCVALEYGLYRLFEHASPGSGPIGLLAGSALLAWPAARLLIEALPALQRSARRSVFEPWQGTYFTFNERQVRFFLIDEKIWIAEADVAAILEPPPDGREQRALGVEYGRIPGQQIQGYTENGLARLLHSRTSHRRATHDMIRFKRWLEHEALPNVKRLPSSSADAPRNG